MKEQTAAPNIQWTKGKERTGVQRGGVGDGVEEPKEDVMVHSGSSSPMKTTPSASPHLTVPATAPPLQAAPLVPPPGDITDQDLTKTPTKFLTTDLTSNADLTQLRTPSLANTEPHVETPAKVLATNSSPASARSSTPTLTPAQSLVNGRSSGRKRTPKACDCCGPNSKGHNDKTSGRGKGRVKGRGRGRVCSDFPDTPKRKMGGQLNYIKNLDLTKETVEEAEDDNNGNERVQTTVVVADTRSQTPAALPVTVSLQDGPMRNSAAIEKEDAQKKEEMLIEGSGAAGGKGGGDSRDVEMRLSGMAGRGAPAVRGRGRGGRGMVGVMSAAKTEVAGGLRRGGLGGVFISSRTYSLPRSVLVQRANNHVAEMNHGEETVPITVESPFGNGDTVNLSDTEPEEDAKEYNLIMSGMENGQSGPASRSGSTEDLDSEMQVDQNPDRTDLVSRPATLSNGNITTLTNEDHCPTLMEVETTHPATVAPSPQGPISVTNMQHCWALRDHRLYCQPGTWEKEQMDEVLGKIGGNVDGKMQDDEESLEQLTDTIHGKM